MKVKVLCEQHVHTGKDNVRSDYVRGQVFEMEDEYVPQQVESGNVELVAAAVHVSAPEMRQTITPAPAPKIGKGE